MNGRKFIDLDTTTLCGFKPAKRTNIISFGLIDVIVTQYCYEIAHLFNEYIMGCAYAYFRHPVDRHLDDMLSGVTVPVFFMT